MYIVEFCARRSRGDVEDLVMEADVVRVRIRLSGAREERFEVSKI